MLYWIIQVIFCSVLFILLIHNIIHFLKTTLTVTKVKDLVNTRNQKYEEMYNIINDENNHNISNYNHHNNNNNNEMNYSIEDLLPKNETNMKDELKNFLKTQINNDSTDISTLETVKELDSYSFI